VFRRVTDISDANNPEALAQLLEGRSDEEINEFVNAAGVDTVLAQVFDAMKERLDAQKAAGQTAVVQWDVTASDGRVGSVSTIAFTSSAVERVALPAGCCPVSST